MRGPRRLACLALFVLCGLLVSGCGDSPDVAELTFRTLAAPGSDEYRVLERVLETFHKDKASRGIRVTLVGDRQKLEYVLRNLIARRSADVVEVRAGEVAFLASRGAVESFPAYCMLRARECHRAAWRWGVLNQELYAIPWAARPKLLLYDKGALGRVRGADAAPPRTWDELLRVAARLREQADEEGAEGVYPFALAAKRSVDLGRHFATFLSQLGPPLLEEREGRWAFNIDHRAGRAAMRFLLHLRQSAPPECVVSGDKAALDQFHSGRAAMVLAGPEGLWIDPDRERQMDIGVARVPVPGPRAASRCDVGLRYVVVPAFLRGARKEAAVRLAKFMAGEEAQEIVREGVGGATPMIPVRRAVLAGEWYRRRPELGAFAAALDHAAPVVPWFAWEGKCSKDWIGGLHSLLIQYGEPGEQKVNDVAALTQTRGDQALSCLHTRIGHPSATMTLGMSIVGVLVFIAVAYAASRH